jgi:amino acid permease
MTDLIAGIVALAIALGFLGVLVYKVTSVPLWIVILLGAAMMVASFLEARRGEESG